MHLDNSLYIIIVDRKANGVATGAFPQYIETSFDRGDGRLFCEVLEIDRQLGVNHIQTAIRARAIKRAMQACQG